MSLNAITDNHEFVVTRNRDKKSHSKTYLKQAQKRDQTLADAINSLPNKLKKKLATDMPATTQQTVIKKTEKRHTNSPAFRIMSDCEDDHIALQDAMAELEDEAALIAEETRLAKLEAADAEYRGVIHQRQEEMQTKRELEFQIYFQKKTQYNEGSSSTEEMRKIRDALILYEMQNRYESESEEYWAPSKCEICGDEFDEAKQLGFHSTVCKEDEESVDGNLFMIHQHNLAALTRYYEEVAVNPDALDAEYEFWLIFEIRAFEEEGSRSIVDVEATRYQEEVEMMDADDRMQQYIEDRADDSRDDRD